MTEIPEDIVQRLPLRSSGFKTVLPLEEVGVQSVVGELRCHMLCGEAKKKKKDIVQNDKDTKGQACSRTNQCAFFFVLLLNISFSFLFVYH